MSAPRRQTIRASKRVRTASRDARVAETEVRSRTVTIVPPKRLRSDYSSITVNLVLVKEAAPPSGEIPIQWLLITTLPIETNEQVQAVITAYALRWQIEVYFKTLKSGCRIESRYFERLPRLLNCLAIYSIVAWKIMQLCRLSRECPDLSCEVIFEPCEWKSVYMAVRRQPPPKTPPTLNEMVKMIASLGGYVIRKSTNPGTQTLWFGMQRLHDLSMGWTTFGPDVPRQKIFFDKHLCGTMRRKVGGEQDSRAGQVAVRQQANRHKVGGEQGSRAGQVAARQQANRRKGVVDLVLSS